MTAIIILEIAPVKGMGSTIRLIIRAEGLIKLPEGLIYPVGVRINVFCVLIPVIAVQLVVGIVIVEGGIDIQDIIAFGLRTCRNVHNGAVLTGLSIANGIDFIPIAAAFGVIINCAVAGVAVEAGAFSSPGMACSSVILGPPFGTPPSPLE